MILRFEDDAPALGEGVFVADNATVLGKVTLGAGSSVWYGSVLRGDVGTITLGARTNIQDNGVIHVTGGKYDTTVGDDVTVGHRALLHGCTIGNHVLVGMGAIVMDGAQVEDWVLVGAGALVTPNTRIPTGVLAVGAPARPLRPLTEAERDWIRYSAQHYVELAARHVAGCGAP